MRETGGLYDPTTVRDACGVGFVAERSGAPTARVLPAALQALAGLAHRGAVDADGRTGDGAGVLTAVPEELFRPLAGDAPFAVGMLFLPRERALQAAARRLVEESLAAAGLDLLAWRDVPVRDDALGMRARRSRPAIAQVLAACPDSRRLPEARRAIERQALAAGLPGVAVVSLSDRTLVYKALVRATDLAACYPDLTSPAYRTPFAVFHQRFSTNTFPSWALAQPFRQLAHNGEINTIAGNRSWMRARFAAWAARGARPPDGPAMGEQVSDSASLDEALSLLLESGRGPAEAMALLMAPAWEQDDRLPSRVRDLLECHAGALEPWDGPALAVWTDGRTVGATLDRNGLRPARYQVHADGLVVLASEAGLVDADEACERGRLGPGEMLAVDMDAQRVVRRDEVLGRLARARPYGALLRRSRIAVPEPAEAEPAPLDPGALGAFGLTREEQQLVLGPLQREGLEPVGSMGDDTPLAVLSPRPRLLSDYFRQRFAQVTNPPIDSLRESLVMSLATRLGPRPDVLAGELDPPPHVSLASPLLEPAGLDALRAASDPRGRRGPARRCSRRRAAPPGSDRRSTRCWRERSRPRRTARRSRPHRPRPRRGPRGLPALLAVSAVHQHLARKGLRTGLSLAVEAGEARDHHQVAALFAFGAEAVCPYVGLALAEDGEGRARYLKALEKGLLKILSKMGLSTLRSYVGGQLFEAVGLGPALIGAHFTGTPSLVGGLELPDIAAETLARHAQAFAAGALPEGGFHRFRRNGDTHAYAPDVVKALHAAARDGGSLRYEQYARLVAMRPPVVLRDLLELVPARRRAPLDEVEPAAAIVPRFMSAAMSLGALSPEAHSMLAEAMNRLGARSNSGEGGEDGARNQIRQVASARFGVTTEYVATAAELQIKMAQGSKPGEGGQLPGRKAVAHIARVRHAPVGATLISPPPHHDIYSIEDLAQLVHDLRRVNPRAPVGVKLVSQAGVGTVAVGVAKADADAVLIGGHDGGTGASPLASIKHAGTPWELGLAEAQQALVANGLRGRVRLQVEGGLKTGRDVMVAALLGADEFGFGSAALVAAGCVMARQCHLDTCPAGIATQREDLRARFKGRPEDVIRFFTAVAEEVREILSWLGARRLQDVIGRVDLLRARPCEGKAATLDLRRLLAPPPGGPLRFEEARRQPSAIDDVEEGVLRHLRDTPQGPIPLTMTVGVTNASRSFGARIAGELTRRHPGRRLPPGTLRLKCRGAAGQSFGAFLVDGLRLDLQGEANDYVGKGLSGGEIVVHRPGDDGTSVLAGNTCLYGATGGRLFVAGRAGERFAVRNSGAVAVVEGVGDHGCEYMTAGAVVVLGPVGRNFGAGMSGGRAFVVDALGGLVAQVNPELVDVDALDREEEAWLREALVRHRHATGSAAAARLLDDWIVHRLLFARIAPREGIRTPLPAWEGMVRARHAYRPPQPAVGRAAGRP
jgi:glutamate synthase domain-containing protein 2/glutamate synthase domain-containing protein 1/glutamate synthase domain-containing protein 3